jgi:glycosyltransferase involved in cell wall biosynthesis
MIEIHQRLKISVIVPAFNEEEHVGKIVKMAKAVDEVDEVLLIDDGSEDDTVKAAKQADAKVVSFKKNRGKGYAMKKGCEIAKGDILIFIDADLKNINPKKIKRILNPFKEGYEFVKTRFDRRGGRVTRLTAKPLLSHFFPEIEKKFEQPLSGQIGIKKKLMKRLDLEEDMGVDIGILIDVVEMNAKTKQVYFGWLIHDEKELKDLDNMARIISRVILDKAAKYDRVDKAIAEVKMR